MRLSIGYMLLLFYLSCGINAQQEMSLHSDMGDIHLHLFPETPGHTEHFMRLAENNPADTFFFYQVIRDQLIGFGPTPEVPVPGYILEPEIKYPLRSGALAAALADKDLAHSDGSHFFIVQGRPQTDATLDAIEQKEGIRFSADDRRIYKQFGGQPQLHGKYTVFGQVMRGMEVVDRIAAVPRDARDRPLREIRVWLIETGH